MGAGMDDVEGLSRGVGRPVPAPVRVTRAVSVTSSDCDQQRMQQLQRMQHQRQAPALLLRPAAAAEMATLPAGGLVYRRSVSTQVRRYP
jgi:hypothetical protein